MRALSVNALFTFLFFTSNLFAQAQLKTTFELSGGKETATYDRTISFYQKLAKSSPYVHLEEMGKTDSGKPLHIVIIDIDKEFDFDKSRKKNKTIILINNGIHPGEPDGIEASKMLVRDYVTEDSKRSQLKNIILAIIPVYNIGGALNRNTHSRANQNGPEIYGFRGNARNFDLNRDFVKADTRNTMAFYDIFHEVNPDIFIDTHVSNGADYQYTITHLATQHNKMGGELGKFIEQTFTPELEAKMNERGDGITPYVNVFNTTPDESGFSQFLDRPRYSTGYATLFHSLGFMIETHMLKPFDTRVASTYQFLEAMVELADLHGTHIQKLRLLREAHFKGGNLHPISWKLDKTTSKEIEFKGFEGEKIESEITGQTRLYYDRDKPFTKKIKYYNTFSPDVEIEIPLAYIIPQGWHEVITRLKNNKALSIQIQKDTTINVESYRIKKFETSQSPYEGHYPHSNTMVEKVKKEVTFRTGDYIFYTNQFAGRYLVEVLEPSATDSFFNWNFFDTILQQKEHFSPYVFEDVAKELLENNDALKVAFDKRKVEDKEFANNWYAQLDFIYKRSSYYESAHMQYPIYRLVD